MADLAHELCFTTCFDFRDQAGGGVDATLVNGATCVQGEGIVLDGVNDYVDLAAVELGGEMTIAIWAKFENLSNWGALFDFDDGVNNNSITVSHAGDTGTLFSGFQAHNGFWYGIHGTGSQISVGEWKYFVIMIGGDEKLREYSDGVQGGDVSCWALPTVMIRTYHHLATHTTGGYLHGAIRSLRIWRRALAAHEVAELTTLELLSDSTCFGMPTSQPTLRPSNAPTISSHPTPFPSMSPTPLPTTPLPTSIDDHPAAQPNIDLTLTSVALAAATASTMVVGGALTIAASVLMCAWQ